jgi:HdeA/HdeB family
LKHCVALLALACSLVFYAVPADAQKPADEQKIEVADITCNDLLAGYLGDNTIIFWIYGYFSGKSGETTLDLKTLEENIHKFADYCRSHEKLAILPAIKEALK